MDLQLKQTAFFGSANVGKNISAPRSLERHYHAPGLLPPASADVASRDVVGGTSKSAADTLESVAVRPVPLVDQAAARALPTGVARIDEHDRDALQRRLVFDQLAQLGKAPIRLSCPLVPLDLNPVPDTPEIFEDNKGTVALGIGDDGFRNHVVSVALEPGLLPGSAPQCPFCRARSDLLERPAAGMVTAAGNLDLVAGIGLAVIADGDIDDPEIHAMRVLDGNQRRFIGIDRSCQHPLAADKAQIDLALGAGQSGTLMFGAFERDLLAAGYGPNRHDVLTRQEPEDPFVERLCSVTTEMADCAPITDLEGVGDFTNAAHGRLRGQAEAFSQLGIAEAVKVKLAANACANSAIRQTVARCVAPLQCLSQEFSCIAVWEQADRDDELHRSDAFLRFDVAAHDRFRDGANRASVITAAPHCRQARPQRSELGAQQSAGAALEAIDDLGDAQGRVGLDEQVHVIRHHFHRMDGHAVIRGDRESDFPEPGIYGRDQHWAPVLGAENDVVFQAVNSPGTGFVSCFRNHAAPYRGAGFLIQGFRTIARTAIPLSAKADSFLRSFL